MELKIEKYMRNKAIMPGLKDGHALLSFMNFRAWLSKQSWVDKGITFLNSPLIKSLYADQLGKLISKHIKWRYQTPQERYILHKNVHQWLRAYYYYSGQNGGLKFLNMKTPAFNKLVQDLLDEKKTNKKQLGSVPPSPYVKPVVEEGESDAQEAEPDKGEPKAPAKPVPAAKPVPSTPQVASNADLTVLTSDSLSLAEKYHNQVVLANRQAFEQEFYKIDEIPSDKTLAEIRRIAGLHKKDVFVASPFLYQAIHSYENPLPDGRQLVWLDDGMTQLSDAFVDQYIPDQPRSADLPPNVDFAVIEDNSLEIYSKLFNYGGYQSAGGDYAACVVQTSVDLGDSMEEFWRKMPMQLFQLNGDRILTEAGAPVLKSPTSVLSFLRGQPQPEVTIQQGVELMTANAEIRRRNVSLKERPADQTFQAGDIVYYANSGRGPAPTGWYQIISRSSERFVLYYYDNDGMRKTTEVAPTTLTKYVFTRPDSGEGGEVEIRQIGLVEEPYIFYTRYLQATGQQLEPLQIAIGTKEQLNTQATRFASVFNIRDFHRLQKIENGQSIYLLTFN